MSTLEIHQLPTRRDNYVYILREDGDGKVAIVDPSDAQPVFDRLEALSWTPTHILCTHHHNDHTGGVLEIKQRFNCTVVGPRADRDRIPGIDVAVADGDRYRVGAAEARVFDTPGHTRGHIAFWFPDSAVLFCGDTLFALGCGRLFEGTAEQMWSSLSKLRSVPDDTLVYCAHEYTQANAKFCLSIQPDSAPLIERARDIDASRAAGRPTVPSTMGTERRTNPFLRADTAEMQRAVGLPAADPIAVFAEIRARKDKF